MPEIDVNRIDLNLLKVFSALAATGSVTGAGNALGLAQSSVSHALERLRQLFGDKLFVRSTGGMRPTPLAQRLTEPVATALAGLQAALDAGNPFDPKTSPRVFRILMSDVVELMVLPQLMRRIRETAPNVAIAIQQMPRNAYRDALESGEAELALGQLPEGHVAFYQQTLYKNSFVCAMRRDHPLRHKLDLKSFLAAEHIVFGSPAINEKLMRRALGPRAAQRRIALSVPHFMIAPFLLAQTDFITVLGESLTRVFADGGMIVGVPLPFKMSPLTLSQFWHHRTHADPGCRWLRAAVAGLFGKRR